MITQLQKPEKSIPQSGVQTNDVTITNGLLLQDGQDKPVIVGMDIAFEKGGSFLIIIVDGMYLYEPL